MWRHLDVAVESSDLKRDRLVRSSDLSAAQLLNVIRQREVSLPYSFP